MIYEVNNKYVRNDKHKDEACILSKEEYKN